MALNEKSKNPLKDTKIDVKIKLSSFWMTIMIIYLYVDIFGFYKPGVIQDILVGKVWEFEITQTWALVSLILMLVPAFMIFLSLTLKAKFNRLLNIIVGILYIIVGIGAMVGETWVFYIFGHLVGILLLLIIIHTAWRWPTSP